MKKKVSILFIIVIVLVSILFVVNDKEKETPIETIVTEEKEVVVITPAVNETDDLIYTDTERGFSLTHPDYLTPENMESGELSFSLQGPTQKPDTEFYDGIALSFLSMPIEDKNLEDIVTEKRNMLIDLYGEVVSGISTIKIDERNSFIFNDYFAQYIYVPQSENKYLEIVNMTKDPENLGYKEVAYKMIENIKILN